jgi:YVTN family beta-propeller protein
MNTVLAYESVDLDQEGVHRISGIGCHPFSVGALFAAFTPDGTKAYVTNQNSHAISVIDGVTDKIIQTISVGFKPSFIAIMPDGTKAYVTNQGSGSVSVIDVLSDKVITSIEVGKKPYFIALLPDGSKAYVTNVFSNTISVIDTQVDRVIETLKVGDTPLFLAITPNGSKVYVVNSFSNTVSVLDTMVDKVIDTLPVGNKPHYIVITSDGRKAYVTNAGSSYFVEKDNLVVTSKGIHSNTVSVIDIPNDRIIETIPVGNKPYYMAVSPDNAKLYVVNFFSNTVSVIDAFLDKVISTIPVGSRPYFIAMTPDGRQAYVTNSGCYLSNMKGPHYFSPEGGNTNTVSVINTECYSVEETVLVDEMPLFMAITPSGNKAYIVNAFSNTISVMSHLKRNSSSSLIPNKHNLLKMFYRFTPCQSRGQMVIDRERVGGKILYEEMADDIR